jgi:hypothetical protein
MSILKTRMRIQDPNVVQVQKNPDLELTKTCGSEWVRICNTAANKTLQSVNNTMKTLYQLITYCY